MTDPSPLRVLIRAKLADGGLPINSIPRVWGGPGNGETCDACEKIITKDEFVMEGIGVEGSRQPIQLHVACFRLWDEERRQSSGAGTAG
jgi:hypothetical protein